MLLSGDMVEAEEALSIGLVSKVVPDDELMPAARDLAERIAVNAPMAVKTAKQALRLARKGDGQELRRHLKDSLATLLAS